MNLSSYLHKRPNSQNWQLRLMIPKPARPLIGRTEFTKSLKVADRKQAERLAFPIMTAWRARIDDALNIGPVVSCKVENYKPSLKDLDDLAVEVGYNRIGDRLPLVIEKHAKSGEEEYRRFQISLKTNIEQLRRYIYARDHDYWKKLACSTLAEKGWDVPVDSVEFSHYCLAIGNAHIDAYMQAKAQLEGEPYQPSSFVQETINRKLNGAKPGETITDLFEKYATQRIAERRKRRDTIDQDRKVVHQFAAFVGASKNVRALKASDVRDWRDVLAVLPANYRKTKSYAGLSQRQAADRAKELGVKGMSTTTVNKYLSTISPFFAWCRINGYAEINPCEGLFYDIKKGLNPRPPFTADELNRILTSPLFNGFLRDGKEHLPGVNKADDWRYWIPLVCLFTGSRVGEIAQLHVADVKQERGIWFFHIRNDEDTGQRTKSNISRPCPIHAKLQEIGFLDFHRRQTARFERDGNPQLFPELEANDRGHIGATPSRFWRRYLSAIGIKKDADGRGSHSFRHTMADQLRTADYLDDEIEVILGHNQKTVTGGYGKIKQGTVNRLSEMMNNVTFEGVSFDHLTPKIAYP